MLNEARKNELLDLTAKLIHQKSYSGEEKGVVRELENYMLSNGFDMVMGDQYGNVIGKIVGKRPGPKVLFDGHVDTVPVANPAAWTRDPFGAEIEDGKIGRASCRERV